MAVVSTCMGNRYPSLRVREIVAFEECFQYRVVILWLGDMQAAQKDLPGLEEDIAAGKFEGLKNWLNEAVHKKGSLYASGDELMIAATGSPLDPSIFLGYLKEKYSKLYKL